METATSGGVDRSMEAFLQERAQQLFLLTDRERKGFIVKRDMQRMRSEIPLTPDQLEAVFDSLDVNKNGYLTIEQFLSGFGEFIASHQTDYWEEGSIMESSQKEIQEHDEPIEYLLRQLESIAMLHSVEVLRHLCQHVERETNPHIQNKLEIFLQQLVTDLKRCQEEQRNMEEALKLRDDEHQAEVHRLFEEMETQLREEKRNHTRHEEQRLRLRCITLEQDLAEKEQQLQEALTRQQELAERVRMLRSREIHIKEENERLVKSKNEIEAQLQAQNREIMQAQRFLDDVRQNEAWERRKHLSTGFRLAKRIMLEQQGLMHQLQLLQQITSTLEAGGKMKTPDRNCQDNSGIHSSTSHQSHGMTLWRRHLYNLDSDFSEAKDHVSV